MEEKAERWSCIFLREIYNKNVDVLYIHCYITPEKYRYRNQINSEKKIMKKNRWEQAYREGEPIMRNMEFKMERQGLLTVGQEVGCDRKCSANIILLYDTANDRHE